MALQVEAKVSALLEASWRRGRACVVSAGIFRDSAIKLMVQYVTVTDTCTYTHHSGSISVFFLILAAYALLEPI